MTCSARFSACSDAYLPIYYVGARSKSLMDPKSLAQGIIDARRMGVAYIRSFIPGSDPHLLLHVMELHGLRYYVKGCKEEETAYFPFHLDSIVVAILTFFKPEAEPVAPATRPIAHGALYGPPAPDGQCGIAVVQYVDVKKAESLPFLRELAAQIGSDRSLAIDTLCTEGPDPYPYLKLVLPTRRPELQTIPITYFPIRDRRDLIFDIEDGRLHYRTGTDIMKRPSSEQILSKFEREEDIKLHDFAHFIHDVMTQGMPSSRVYHTLLVQIRAPSARNLALENPDVYQFHSDRGSQGRSAFRQAFILASGPDHGIAPPQPYLPLFAPVTEAGIDETGLRISGEPMDRVITNLPLLPYNSMIVFDDWPEGLMHMGVPPGEMSAPGYLFRIYLYYDEV